MNKLDPIISQKAREVASLQTVVSSQPTHAISQLMQGKTQRNSNKNFKNALRSESLSVIAEIKRKSPSKGELAIIGDPVSLAKTYVEGGASAISVLTDEKFFNGTLEDLTKVTKTIQAPVLRKDFIIDTIQIAEAIVAGADAILCIVAVVKDKTKDIIHHANAMGIDVLVEVHNEKELEIALTSGSEIIGINNRDLSTFYVDTQKAFNLLPLIPKNVVTVAESGIITPTLAREYYRAGFDAVLIGEALVTSTSPAKFIRDCRHD